MSTIIYCHGFGSTGSNPKSSALRAAFPNDTVVSPDLPIDPSATLQILTKIVHTATSFPIVFVGTSLGGFWANYCAHKFDAPCVLVNPSMTPSATMSLRIGKDICNYVTGEPIVVTSDHVAQFSKLQDEAEYLSNGALIHLFLAMDDDVVDYRKTVASLPFVKSRFVTTDGGHRYEEKWSTVIDLVKTLT